MDRSQSSSIRQVHSPQFLGDETPVLVADFDWGTSSWTSASSPRLRLVPVTAAHDASSSQLAQGHGQDAHDHGHVVFDSPFLALEPANPTNYRAVAPTPSRFDKEQGHSRTASMAKSAQSGAVEPLTPSVLFSLSSADEEAGPFNRSPMTPAAVVRSLSSHTPLSGPVSQFAASETKPSSSVPSETDADPALAPEITDLRQLTASPPPPMHPILSRSNDSAMHQSTVIPVRPLARHAHLLRRTHSDPGVARRPVRTSATVTGDGSGPTHAAQPRSSRATATVLPTAETSSDTPIDQLEQPYGDRPQHVPPAHERSDSLNNTVIAPATAVETAAHASPAPSSIASTWSADSSPIFMSLPPSNSGQQVMRADQNLSRATRPGIVSRRDISDPGPSPFATAVPRRVPSPSLSEPRTPNVGATPPLVIPASRATSPVLRMGMSTEHSELLQQLIHTHFSTLPGAAAKPVPTASQSTQSSPGTIGASSSTASAPWRATSFTAARRPLVPAVTPRQLSTLVSSYDVGSTPEIVPTASAPADPFGPQPNRKWPHDQQQHHAVFPIFTTDAVSPLTLEPTTLQQQETEREMRRRLQPDPYPEAPTSPSLLASRDAVAASGAAALSPAHPGTAAAARRRTKANARPRHRTPSSSSAAAAALPPHARRGSWPTRIRRLIRHCIARLGWLPVMMAAAAAAFGAGWIMGSTWSLTSASMHPPAMAHSIAHAPPPPATDLAAALVWAAPLLLDRVLVGAGPSSWRAFGVGSDGAQSLEAVVLAALMRAESMVAASSVATVAAGGGVVGALADHYLPGGAGGLWSVVAGW